ncbi:LytR/AlgR family response regulator transcription factor [Paracoccus lutimaris]|uniref:LytTR family two component transcriptional regulator n=1 Tax=Paracoccus lutimaris TaxID=1490030 RepID=A0A368YJT4_9RHOB|nr:LytTR family DNA-binding domain-containing protein [Paracoccus lutimaris]RCW80480.1 LytTR family two component transcriptional regulator [Paracoccus lutimaris]
MTGALRVLIVDDEPIARRRLLRLLAQLDGIQPVGEAGDCDQAVAAIQTLRPDLVMLDLQMPGGDGFAVIERLGKAVPPVIFVTAFDQYALRAFEAAAVDYITKPVEMPRLAAAIERGRAAAMARDQGQRIAELQGMVAVLRAALDGTAGEGAAGSRDLWVRTRMGQTRIGIDSIDYILAERDYMRIFSGGQSYMIAESMAAMQRRLAPMGFLRIHRGVLVRQAAIAGLVRRRYGMLAVRLEDGTELGVGRSHVHDVLQVLGLKPAQDG